MSHNKLESVEDIEHLKECKTLSVVDLSHNLIDDADIVQVFSQMENVVSAYTSRVRIVILIFKRVINLMGNSVLKNVKDYRRTMTLGCVGFESFLKTN